MSSWPDYVSRVVSLSIDGFRGFSKQMTFDTNADIVLVDGGNGFGKSSFIEALQFLLTGRPTHGVDVVNKKCAAYRIRALVATDHATARDDKSVSQWIGVTGPSNADDVHSPGYYCEVANTTPVPPAERDWRRIAADASGGYPPPSIADRLGLLAEHMPRDWSDRRELDLRACAFNPEAITEALDEGARARTLSQIIDARAHWRESLTKEAEEVFGALDGLRRRLSTEDDAEVAAQIVATARTFAEQAWFVFQTAHDEGWLRQVFTSIRPNEEDETFGSAFSRLIAGVASGGEDSAEERLTSWLDRLADVEGDQSGDTAIPLQTLLRDIGRFDLSEHSLHSVERLRLLNERAEKQRQLAVLVPEAERAKRELTDLEDLADVSSAIANRTAIWLQRVEALTGQMGFVNLRQELGAVRVEAARAISAELSAFVETRHRLVETADRLQRDVEAIDERIGTATKRASEVQFLALALSNQVTDCWRPYLALKRRRRTKEERHRLSQELQTAIHEVRDVASWARGDHGDSRGGVVERAMKDRLAMPYAVFHFAGGPPTELSSQDLKLVQTTKDGRGVTHFSTGQKAVAAVSFLLAQNHMLRTAKLGDGRPPLLWHDVLLLDDVSTAYDRSNISREALLWRQLAYQSNSPVQLFLCSHHDELTHGLLELLAPPKTGSGERPRRMVVHRFLGWTLTDGPRVGSFEVEPTGAVDASGRAQLAKDLQRSLA